MKKLYLPLIFALTISTAACSDDEPSDAPRSVTLNMMNADNGHTTLGATDVYINSADNFASTRYAIVDMGRGSNLGAAPDLAQTSYEAAVLPGHSYQFVPTAAIRMVAGEKAFRIGEPYYNAYVESWITDSSNDITGARVSYLECTPKPGILPEWSTSITLRLRTSDYYGEAAYTFSKGVEIDPNVEFYGGDLANSLEVDITDNTIRFVCRAWLGSSAADAVVLVRYNSVYSRVHFSIEN